jgi:hypothetical protein
VVAVRRRRAPLAGFRRFLADGLTRMLVAAQAQEISAAPAATSCCS